MTRLLRCIIFSGLLCAALGGRADAEPPAQIMIRATAEQVLERLRSEGDAINTDPQRVYGIAEEIVLPHFDFARMSQRVLGKHWRQATPEQRARFMEEFKTLLVRTYATAVSEYRDSEIEFLPARELTPETMRIRSQVMPTKGGQPVQISYEVYKQADAWKVYDVAINGVSLVISYRSGFSNDIHKLGLDGLIDQLAQHNAAKAAGG